MFLITRLEYYRYNIRRPMVHYDGTVTVVDGEQSNLQESVLSFRLLEAGSLLLSQNF